MMKMGRLMTATLAAFVLALWVTGAHAAFVDNGNGTVSDTRSGLMWQQDTARDDQGNYDPMTWEESLVYCESRTLGGHTDWRLPTIKELRSLVDYSQRNPAINRDRFPNTVSSYYWSSTTYAYYTDDAWSVYFYDGYDYWGHKSNGHYVRAVRGGQSGSFGNLDHFVISVPSGTKSLGSPFSATIQAVDASGRLVQNFSGDVTLSSSRGPVKPTSARLSGGAATVSVTIDYSGNMCLKCCGPSAAGESEYFQVGTTGSCGGKISGRVIDANEAPLSGATVKVYNQAGTLKGQVETDAMGRYAFAGLCSDTYRLDVKKGEYEATVPGISVSDWTGTPVGDIQLQINGGTGATPVVLVPGMMGSTLPNAALPELCSSAPCKNLIPWDVGGLAGWGELKSALTAAGYKWVECPWDWRWGCDAVYKEYLKDKIDQALSLPGVTATKVHIVAHSMGGLVVRAYLQNKEDYRQDIARVAFVGTPHQGSCNPYYMWEGGDPQVVDDITDSGWKSIANVYTNTLRLLWLRYNLLAGPLSLLRKPTRAFLRDKVGSLNQLLETEAFLYDKNDGSVNSPWAVTTGGNVNQWLKNLNEGNDTYHAPGDVMSPDGQNNTVPAKLFVGKKSGSTIQYVRTEGKTETNDLYQDGIPTFPTRASAQKGTGDGTVPYASATWPEGDGWADLYGIQYEEDHVSLIKRYKNEIVAFLSGDLDSGQTLSTAQGGDAQEGAAGSTLSVSIVGDMRLLVTAPNGLKTGIDPSTQDTVEQIASAACTFASEGGGVSIPNAGSGTYQVQYFGEQERDFVLSLGYMDDETTESLTYQGFRPTAARTFSVAVNPTGNPRLTITPPLKAPTHLQAHLYTSEGVERTFLMWGGTGEAGVTGYNIYAVSELEPYFKKIDETGPGSSFIFVLTDLWSSDNATPVKTYAVTAVKSDGTESFFSNLVQNNDRDHDGLTDAEEPGLSTDPTKADTDGDGLKDGDEQSYNTNPLVGDTDGDGYNDYAEVQGGSDPLDPQSVPAPTLPTVTTAAVSAITPTTATSGGNVTSDGGADVTARGVCWGISEHPTTAGPHTSNGTGEGSFVSQLTGLTPGTPYYVCAYAINSQGTSYGSDVSFTTHYSGMRYVNPFGSCGDYQPCYSSIQAALDAAADGDTILVRHGDYYETIVLDEAKSLTLLCGRNDNFGPGTLFSTAYDLEIRRGSLIVEGLQLVGD